MRDIGEGVLGHSEVRCDYSVRCKTHTTIKLYSNAILSPQPNNLLTDFLKLEKISSLTLAHQFQTHFPCLSLFALTQSR